MGKISYFKGKIKIELPKTTNIDKITKEEAVKMIEAKTPKERQRKNPLPRKKQQKEIINHYIAAILSKNK